MPKRSHERGKAAADGRYNVRAVERAIAILDAFSQTRPRLSLDEVSRETGLSKPTAFRILATLQYHGYVAQDPADGRYRLGARVLGLAHAAIDSLNLRDVARPHLDALRDELGVTVLLGALMDGDLVYVDKREAPGPVRIASDVGWRRDPPYFGMLGMTLLAFRPEDELERLLGTKPLRAYTDRTITDPAAFRERLRQIRAEGVLAEFGEAVEGVWGVAAPVRDGSGDVVAAVGVALPMTAAGPERVAAVKERVRACGEAISADLGAGTPG
ncbi:MULTISPECIES: IclR family transcriptional regulator [Deferrisoma]